MVSVEGSLVSWRSVCVSAAAAAARGGSDSEQTAVGYRLADDLNSTVVIGSN